MTLAPKKSLLLFPLICLVNAQPQPPQVGYTQLRDGRLARVMGVSGALVVEAAGEHAPVVAWSGHLLITGTPGPAPAVIGFSTDGRRAAAAHADTGRVWIHEDGEWRESPVRAPGATAVSLTADGNLRVVVAAAAEIRTFRLSDGAETASPETLPPFDACVWSIRGDLAVARSHTLSYRDRELTLPEPLTVLYLIGPRWIRGDARSGARYAIRLEPELAIYQLPEVAP